MARFRRKSRRRFSFGRRSSRRSRSNGGSGLMSILIPSFIYGAAREKASNALAPITAKVPLGNIADEVVMGGIGYLAMKKGNGIVRDLGKTALTIETARVGEAVVNGQVSMGGMSQSASSYNFG